MVIDYACVNPETRLDWKCFRAKASYVVMEACFGTAEILASGGEGSIGVKGGGTLIKNVVKKETKQYTKEYIRKNVKDKKRSITNKMNKLQGRVGENLVFKQLEKMGYKIEGKQVTAKTKKGIRYIDILIRDKNNQLIAVEVKTGKATRSLSQKEKDRIMKEFGAYIKKNAPNMSTDKVYRIPTYVIRPF